MCLSPGDLNQQSRLEWQCSQGHRWTARLIKVKRGNWCPQCAGKGPVTILHMRRLAAERGGKCLAKEYRNNHTPLQWRCAEGHEWWARPQDIRRTWCPYCARTARLEIQDLRRIARSRGGRLLSTLYINGKTPLLWCCHDGHVWNGPAASVKPNGFHSGTWCPLMPATDERETRSAVDRGDAGDRRAAWRPVPFNEVRQCEHRVEMALLRGP